MEIKIEGEKGEQFLLQVIKQGRKGAKYAKSLSLIILVLD